MRHHLGKWKFLADIEIMDRGFASVPLFRGNRNDCRHFPDGAQEILESNDSEQNGSMKVQFEECLRRDGFVALHIYVRLRMSLLSLRVAGDGRSLAPTRISRAMPATRRYA